MSKLHPSSPSIFFFPLIFSHKLGGQSLEKIIDELGVKSRLDYLFPKTAESSNPISYYTKEMGEDLSRIVIFDTTPEQRNQFVDLKLKATKLEQDYSVDGGRLINIDVGRLSMESMELASGKMYSHRVYLDHGVYSDLHYTFKDKKFRPTPWCYPDYAQDKVLEFFTFMRTCR